MLTLRGKGASGGVAMGRARLLKNEKIEIGRDTVTDTAAEWKRYERARDAAVSELESLHRESRRTVGEEQAEIFRVQAMMAQDEDFDGEVRHGVLEQHYNAEYALVEAQKMCERLFSEMDDAYMQQRAGDVRDVAARILRHLQEADETTSRGDQTPYILCADDLTPSQTVSLDRRAVLAFVTARGSTNSHSAILARTMNLPAVVDVGAEQMGKIKEGMLLAVDGDRGLIYVDPGEGIRTEWEGRMQRAKQEKARLDEYRDRESVTPDGRLVEITANVGDMADVQAALSCGADGIGLFRSEFLYLGRENPPDEEEQFSVYRAALSAMPDKRVVIRTLDVGADKQVPYFGLDKEENPALGMRASRISLARPQVFLTQARALLRASVFGRLAVMFPLIARAEEVEALLELWEQAKRELAGEGVPYAKDVEIGIMIETPAAAVISDRLAPLVDFFSIGTNDLSQYTLAMDRQNAALAERYPGYDESVLRLIRYAAESARRAGIWVGVCGEWARDPALTEEFLNMGVTELSVSPGAVLALRARVCTLPAKRQTETDMKGDKK